MEEWERVAAVVADVYTPRLGVIQALNLALHGANWVSAGWTQAEVDFWRGWMAEYYDPAIVAFSDALVEHEDAYAAGALARSLAEAP